jgi:hypothetical protein
MASEKGKFPFKLKGYSGQVNRWDLKAEDKLTGPPEAPKYWNPSGFSRATKTIRSRTLFTVPVAWVWRPPIASSAQYYHWWN